MASVKAMRTFRGRRARPLAPLALRFGAGVIDTAIAIGALLFALAAGIAVYAKVSNPGEDREQPSRRQFDPSRAAKALQSRKVGVALHLVSLALSLLMRGARSPGHRIVGIRVVDAGTGGPVTRRQALVRGAVRAATQALQAGLTRERHAGSNPELEVVRSELEAAAREHAGDPSALEDAVKRTYASHKTRPMSLSCLSYLLRSLPSLAIGAPVWSPLRQGLADRLAGTVVVVDR
jgi:uncharacterized RDD family membrane protein YckC